MNEQLVKPEATPEVEKFLGLWEQYHTLVRDHRWSSLERYGRDCLAVVDMNEAIAEDVVNSLNPILELGEAMRLLGEDVAKAATEFKSAEYAYNQAVKDEADKPRLVWEEAKDAMVRDLKKEERSLAIKLGKLSNKRWRGTEIEQAYIEEQYGLLCARQRIVELTLSDIQWMRYSDHEGTEFTMDLVAETVEYRRDRINELIAKYDAKRLQEADA